MKMWHSCLLLAALAGVSAMAQGAVYESVPVTRTATIQSIDKTTRVVTLKGEKGSDIEVTVPPQLEGFNSLKVGDHVSATYYDAVALNIRKPGDPAPAAPVTSVQRKEGTPGSQTRKEQTFTAIVDAVDPSAPSVRLKGPQGRVVTLAVRDAAQLKNIKAGDAVDVTYYQSLMVKVSPAPKK
jgi:Cu/Ag efflux protein CusF